MLFLKRISRMFLVFGFMIAIGISVQAHESHNIDVPHLDFSSDPTISCDIDGWYFHHKRTTVYGEVIADFWYKEPRKPKFTIEATAHGRGWAYIKLWGDVNGIKFGDENNAKSDKLGKWSGLIPWSFGVGDHDVWAKKYGHFSKEPGIYNWTANGSIELVPWVWQWRTSGLIPGGEWKEAPEQENKNKDAEASGSWTVTRKWQTVDSDNNEDDDEEDEEDTDETEESEDSEDTSTSQATAPDSPSNLELSPRRIAILVRWEAPTSNGGSAITDYEYSYRRKRTATSWTDWSDWTSAGTSYNLTWITGLRSNRRYEVRLRAVNSVGASSSTSQTVDTKK